MYVTYPRALVAVNIYESSQQLSNDAKTGDLKDVC